MPKQPNEHTALLVYTKKDHGEIMELANAAGFTIRQIDSQIVDHPLQKTYLGSGKVIEIQKQLQDHPEIETVIFDTDLSPMQMRNLEEAFGISTADRTDIIIFLQRASSAQSRLQVENAVLKRSKNRLSRRNINFSRQGGGMKNKGAGETQLELDRRNIDSQIANNEKELARLQRQRSVQRNSRRKSGLPLVSLAGYTNAGKSTLLNGLLKLSSPSSEKTVLEKDQLFATLDPSVRQIERPLGRSYLLTDTVGFISDLPHDLIQGFKTTLEEIALSDLILEVLDASSAGLEAQKQVVENTLRELGTENIELLHVFNKCDEAGLQYPEVSGKSVHICARERESLEALSEKIETLLFGPVVEKDIFIPYTDASVISTLFQDAAILKREDTETGIRARVRLSSHKLPAYSKYFEN